MRAMQSDWTPLRNISRPLSLISALIETALTFRLHLPFGSTQPIIVSRRALAEPNGGRRSREWTVPYNAAHHLQDNGNPECKLPTVFGLTGDRKQSIERLEAPETTFSHHDKLEISRTQLFGWLW